MFPTTIAGSLPKPSWLAEPNKLWAPWRLAGADLEAAKLDATLIAIKLQEDAGIDIVCDGEQARQHFVHGFLEVRRGHRLRAARRDGHPQQSLQGDGADRDAVHCGCAAACTRPRRATPAPTPRASSSSRCPGPMTIVDTIADEHYGDRVKMALAFADLLNEEARALERDGVDVIQFDEPAFNVYMAEVTTWGIEALHRAIDGLACTTAVHICYGYGIAANIDWKASLGGEWRQYEEIFPGAGEKPHRPGLGRMPQREGADATACRCSTARTC